MTSLPLRTRRHYGFCQDMVAPAGGRRFPHAPTDSQPHSTLVRRRGGLITVPGRLTPPETGASPKLTKLLLNVNLQSGLGPVQLVISSENTVRDLIKAAIEIYVKEKRRPLLSETDSRCFELHYSPFSFERGEGLKPEEKLINLRARNFFLCPKPSKRKAANSSWCGVPETIFPLINFMDFLL